MVLKPYNLSHAPESGARAICFCVAQKHAQMDLRTEAKMVSEQDILLSSMKELAIALQRLSQHYPWSSTFRNTLVRIIKPEKVGSSSMSKHSQSASASGMT